MSPIGQPSSTDVMDITVLSTMADQEVSFYGPEQVKEQPRVSTLKLPHLVQQDRSRLASRNDIKVCTRVELSSGHYCHLP